MLGVGVALGSGLVLTRSDPDPCAVVDSTLMGAWDGDAGRRLADAFARHGPPDADTLLPRITTSLDEYAQGWGAMVLESCTATFVEHRQSEELFERRARCLERRRNRVVAAVEALAEVEDGQALMQRAVLPFKLPPLDTCADARALGARGASVEEPEYDERHAALRRRFDEVDSLRESGRLLEALEQGRAALPDAGELGPHLRAEALECIGRVRAEGGWMSEAKSPLELAIVEGSHVGSDAVVARAWLSLVYATTMTGELAEAEHRVLGATAAVERVGDPLLQAWLLNDRGILASSKGDHQEARRLLEEALALKVRELGADHLDVGIALHNLGTMLARSGHYQDASESLARAQAIFDATVGRSSMLWTYTLGGMCTVEYGLDHDQAAVEVCEVVLSRFEQTPVAPLWAADIRMTLANALWDLGRRTNARAVAKHAAEVIASESPDESLEEVARINAWLAEHSL